MNLTAQELMDKGKCDLVLSNPFIASVLLRLRVEECADQPTMCTDGSHILWNADFVTKNCKNGAEVSGVLAHEVLHVVLLHHTRRGDRDPQKWNIAADFAVNGILKANKVALPGIEKNLAMIEDPREGWFCDSQFDGMNTEAIYEKIPDKYSSKGQGGGSVTIVSIGGVQDPTGANGTPKDKAEAEAEAQVMISQAIHAAKQMGKMPLGMDRHLEQSLEVKIDWRERLQKFFRRTKITESTWRRPNRRYIGDNIYLPSELKEPTGTIVVCVDTSGSIGGPELDAFASEMRAIHGFVKPERMIVMYCDAAVGRVDEFGPQDDFELHPVGGGGTSFKPPFAWLEKKDIVPEAFVYLTDGYGDFPDGAEFPVLWVINNQQVTPPWGEHLILEM